MRHGDTFYYSASTMHFSPGAPILRSYDLVNWEYFSHSVPSLDFTPGPSYNLSGSSAYNAGIYASFLNYNSKLKTWYWGGCITNDYKTYIYTAASPEGPWSKKNVINSCYYDCGMLVDDDGTMYVVFLTSWNQKQLYVAQLSADGKEVKRQQVWTTESSLDYVEGWRMYKRGGSYYILGVHPMDGNIILKGSSPWGPFTWKWLVRNGGALVAGARVPRQGGLVTLPNGTWYHMAFIDAYPGGRLPALAPVDWSADGWPTARLVNGQWAKQYPYPLPPRAVKSIVGTDTFNSTSLGPQYEWNHNPDPSAYSLTADGLQLRTATVTDNFFMARNTLTHRILGPSSTLTIKLDYSKLAEGDRAGLVLFDYTAGWIGVVRENNSVRVVMWNGITLSENGWKPNSKGTQVASAAISGGSIWLRTKVNVLPGTQQGTFQYSTDGTTFVNLGNAVTIVNDKIFFMGWRYGVFNFATKARGGSVTVRSYTIDGTMMNSVQPK